MTVININGGNLIDQIDRLVQDNRGLRKKSEADDKTIHLLKDQYDTLQGGVEDMVEDHRRVERELMAERDRAVRAYTEIDGLLSRAADLILQAMRARDGLPASDTAQAPLLSDDRMPRVTMTS